EKIFGVSTRRFTLHSVAKCYIFIVKQQLKGRCVRMKMIPVLPPESPRTTKLMVGIVVTIFLGSIGSGLWDRMLSHVFDWSLTLFLTVISRVFRSYVDYIHEDIGKGAHEIF